eukprot:957903-Prorocentrum_minimum.AAC.1
MSRTVTTMRDGILRYRIARDLGAGRAGSVLVIIIFAFGSGHAAFLTVAVGYPAAGTEGKGAASEAGPWGSCASC